MKRISLTFYPACFVSPKITLFLILLFLSVSSHAEIKSPVSGAEKVVEVIGNLFSAKIIEINSIVSLLRSHQFEEARKAWEKISKNNDH